MAKNVCSIPHPCTKEIKKKREREKGGKANSEHHFRVCTDAADTTDVREAQKLTTLTAPVEDPGSSYHHPHHSLHL